MSSANPVPETWELTGSDVQETLAGTDPVLRQVVEQ